jgi:uncharacterized membrane protein YfcA
MPGGIMNLLQLSFLIIILAFFCEYVDSSLGMGYGTALTPLLLLMGYHPLQIVPAILVSELFTGLTAAFLHHKAKNVDLKFGTKDFKIALVMSVCSIFGSLIAVVIAIHLPAFYIKLYIGILVFSMGILILATLNRTFKFSWKKITSLGLLAAFNKGISGGGYGPIVTSGQILSGVNSKNAIGITSLAEGVTCLIGVITYLALTNHTIEWKLAPSLVVGALLSVPLAALTVKKIKGDYIKLIVGIATVILGLVTLVKLI